MHTHGHIETQTALTILRNIDNHMPIYRARSHLRPVTITKAWDHNTAMTIDYLLQTTLTPAQRLQTQLPIHLGGLGILELTHRSAAAYLGSWQSFATKSSNNYTDTTFKHHYPQAMSHVEEAHQRIKDYLPPGHPAPTWTQWTTNPHDLSQSTLSKLINNQQYDELYATTTVLHPEATCSKYSATVTFNKTKNNTHSGAKSTVSTQMRMNTPHARKRS